MKLKAGILLVLIFILLLVNVIYAQSSEDDGIPDEIQNITDTAEKISNMGDDNESYLKKEWCKILRENEFFRPPIKLYDKVSPYTDPIFKFVLGSEPKLSFLFVLSVVLWVTVLIYFYRILSLFSTFSDLVAFVIALCLTVILSAMKIIPIIAKFIVDSITKFLTTWWIQLIVWAVIITLLIVLDSFSKQIRDKLKERKGEKEEKENREKLKRSAETAERVAEGLNKALGEDE